VSPPLLGRLALKGVRALPPQALGVMSLVPLAREHPIGDLRLCPIEVLPVGERKLPGAPEHVTHFIPHGVVTGWGERGRPMVAAGTTCLATRRGGRTLTAPPRETLIDCAISRRDGGDGVRLLPLHLTLEGLLYACLGLPPETWSRYAESSRARAERNPRAPRGAALDAALRTFEPHPGQCGLLLYAADTLVFALVAPCPDDYDRMHRSVVADLLAGTFEFYARQHPASVNGPWFRAEIPGAAVRTLDDLRKAIRLSRRGSFAAEQALSDGLVNAEPVVRSSETAGDWAVRRFTSALVPKAQNFVGEAIVGPRGATAWLTLHRLSDGYTRRAWALASLASANWNLTRLAAEWRGTPAEAETQLREAGFRHVLEVMRVERVVKTLRRR
jgi:hypothetical protein